MTNILDFNNALRERELEAYLKSGVADDSRADRIRDGLNACAESFIAWMFPAAVFDRRCAKIGNTHGDPGFSLTIETKGSKVGVWKDFGNPDQKGGDLIGLYMAAKGVSFPKALEDLADWIGQGTRPEVNYERQRLAAKAKRVERDLGAPKGEWHYTDADNNIIASVYRFEPAEGGKEFLPWDAVKGAWGNPPVRPLYNIPGILKAQRIIFCEGEKAAKALINLDIPATSVMGGCNSPLDKTDLSPLQGKEVILWADNDEPGAKFAAAVSLALQDIATVSAYVTAPDDAKQGWDAADAVDEGANIAMLLGEQAEPTQRPILPFFWFDEAKPNLEANDFVEGLLTSSAMSVVYGPSNCGKTFFILDLALHVSWGRQWRGRDVEQGAIVYLSLEGAQGIQNRMAAFKRHYKIEGRLPFVAMPKPVNLLDDDADIAAVIQLVHHVAEASGFPVRMVIVDTLSRAMAGGNENSSEDMTALIGNCDRIRSATDAHVCIIHHSGKDEARGARGHSSLRAATDTELEIKRDPEMTFSTVRVAKQRDLEAGDPFNFTLHSVHLGTNTKGKDVTSCVVVEAEKTIITARRHDDLSPKEADAFYTLAQLIGDYGCDPHSGETEGVILKVSINLWAKALKEAETINRDNEDSARKQMSRLRQSLVNKQKISTDGEFVWLS
ncbi:hypothetical protein M527_06515 [Sphingobium indicum IP26]|uniref:AAA+ ATPase domain-containing protein n=1 Tax=Sphingobium indicum F2 TaxID=1450518 RepID=A0A8E0WTU6_9SPHN|nr:AAA family ATPase [Sphingobium indicum]EPR09776.1 hypothetical protein M527_06515 [Sphingobium indicum IP26]KER37274.1 hypothetical protein AL00_06270 [Sphingobium indicum F2]